MSDAISPLEMQYRAALQEYLEGAGENALQQAYEVGREAIGETLGLLDLIAFHREAMRRILRRCGVPEDARQKMEAAVDFLSESIAPFEVTHGGFHEVITRLRSLNETLEQQVEERTAELRAKSREVERNLEQIRILYEINLAVTSSLDLKAILAALLEKANLLLPAMVMTVKLANSDTGRLEAVACWNVSEEEWGESSPNALDDLAKIVFEKKAPVLIPRAEVDRRTKNDDFFRAHRLVSYLGVPLIVRNQVLGVLGFCPSREFSFDREQMDFLATLGGHAAVAIQNSQLFEQVKKQAVELETANRVKSDFTAMVVHDLRSPLAAVMSAAEILAEGLVGPVGPEQKKWLGQIGGCARKVVDLVNDFLDLSKLEAGRVDLVKEEFDLRGLVRQSLENHSVLAREKRISLRNRVAQSIPSIQGDPRRLDQVFSNLLSNAIKFTPEGGMVEVGANVAGTAGEVKIWVKDTGIGIPRHEVDQIFQKYRQTTSGVNSNHRGTGLGLVICKMIVETHGGRIWVESEEGKQSTFFFSLPIHARLEGDANFDYKQTSSRA